MMIAGVNRQNKDVPFSWRFKVNQTKLWQNFTIANLNHPKYLNEEEPPKPTFGDSTLKPFPLEPATILYKTFPYSRSVISTFTEFWFNARYYKDSSTKVPGYCEKLTDDMVAVSNQHVCNGKSQNVGYYIRVTFPIGMNGTIMEFHTPVDFGLGGAMMIDGKVAKTTTGNQWNGGNNTYLDFKV